MIGMALFQGLFDREAHVLEKVRRLVESGTTALDAGSEARATLAFVKALSLLEVRDPNGRFEDFAKAYSEVGEGLLRVRRLESAQAAANHAVELDRENVSALALEADLLVAQGRASDAIRYYDVALRIDPKARDLWQRKGDAYVALAQATEAIQAYMQSVTLDPDDVDGYARVLALRPQDPEIWVRKGDAYRRRNEPDEAQGAYDRALRIESDRKDALEGKALTYLVQGEPQRALRCLDRVIQIDPYDANAWRLRGDVLAASSQNEEALRSYDEALRQRDEDANAWHGRAELLRKIGRASCRERV